MMQFALSILLMGFLFIQEIHTHPHNLPASATTPPPPPPAEPTPEQQQEEQDQQEAESKVKTWHGQVQNIGVSFETFERIINAYDYYKDDKRKLIDNTNIIIYVDYRQPLMARRFYVLELPTGGEGSVNVKYAMKAAHGLNNSEGSLNLAELPSCQKDAEAARNAVKRKVCRD